MEGLKILHQVYSNSLEDDASIQYLPIPNLKINLRRHQHAVIEHMIDYENSYIKGKHIENAILYSKYGILGDSVGVGKTFMILGHIAKLNNERKVNEFTYFNSHSSKSFYSLEKQVIHDISNVGCLIVVPHTLFCQWADEIKKNTNLKVLLLKTRKNVSSDNFMKNVQEAEITLVSNTLFKDLYLRSNELNLFWNRIYIDEADTIEITSSIIHGNLPTNFIWLITASFTNLLFSHSYGIYIGINSYDTFKQQNHISNDLDNYLTHNLNNTYQSYYIRIYMRSARYLNEIINTTHPMRGYSIIRCSKNFINQSISLPQLYSRIIICKPSFSHRIVYDVISSTVKQLLNAGDIKSALEQLGVKTENNASLIEAVSENKQKELIRLETTYEFKQSLEYSSIQVKETALKNLKEKIDSLKEQIKSLKERIENYKEDICPICYDEPSDAVLTNCCSRIFCAMCILQSLSRNPTCPLCRRDMHPSSLKKISEENIIIENNEVIREDEPKKKIDALFEIIEQNPNGKFLIFSRYDNSFLEVVQLCVSKKLVAKELKGSKDIIASILTNFKDGKVNLLLMNTLQMGAGLNITEATHVILLHSMTHEEEKQILGRAYRVGRTKELQFIKLLYPDEI